MKEKSQEETPMETMQSMVFGFDMDEEDIIKYGIPKDRPTTITKGGQSTTRRK